MRYRLFPFLLFAAALSAQTASVTGRITDPSGAVVPGATVTVQSVQTGVQTTVETNAEGYYHLPSLLPGSYHLTVRKAGFVPRRHTGLTLAVQQVARLDLSLEVGAVTETIEVRAQAVLLDSETSTLGQVVQGRQIVELPLLGRNPYALAGLVPGVRTAAGMNDLPVDQISTAFTSINGQRANQNEYLLDGAPNTAAAQNQPVIYANVDSVQEFKVETNSFSAEYGRAAGGVFNVVTKGGTNDHHFTVYDFFRNDKLNANDWFANRSGRRRPPFKFNQFGGTVGGPLVRNKTFYFGSVELVRYIQGITFTGTVPRPEQLTGDFSRTFNAAGALIQVYDPLSTRPNPAGAGSVRDPFARNVIPADRIDPVARNIAKFWPGPNTAGVALTGVNNFARTDGNRVRKDTLSLRFDHHFSERNRIFSRFSYDDSPLNRAQAYGPEFPASPGAGPQVFSRRNAIVEDVHTFSPTLLGTFRWAYARLSNFRRPRSDGFDMATLGFPAGLAQQIGDPFAFPAIIVTGFNVTGSIPNIVVGGTLGATDTIAFGMDQHTWQAQLTKTFTRHTVKTGFDYRLIRANLAQHGDQATQFSFANNWTQGPNPAQSSATAGYALASFLLGVGAGSVTPAPALAHQTTYYALFVQDDFKVTPRLTLNLGLRYDYESPRTDRFNQLTNFDYAVRPPLQAPGLDLRGALSFVGVAGASRFQSDPDRNNFAPRLGFAYKLTAKTVLRGGGGFFFAPTTGLGGASGAFGVSGFTATTTLVTSLDGITPLTFLRNPYPNGITRATGSSLGAATLLGQTISFFDRSNRVPYAEQWNFNVQRELPGAVLLDLGYAGSHGLKFAQDRVLNQIPDAALALGNDLRTQVPNPFFGQIASGPLAQRTVSRAQLLRPFPHFDAVASTNANWAASIYHALQVKVEKRYARGFTVLGAYTYSKMMDDATGQFSGEALGGGGFQNWNSLRADRSVSSLDQTHRFIVNTVWALPFGSGRRWGGWEFGAVFSAFSGGPLGITSATNNTFSQGGGQRPDWSGRSPRLADPAPDRWFDTAVFSTPPAYRFGNAGRTFSGSRSDGTGQIDLSFHKNTRLGEKLAVQFRAEFFNLTNSPRFAPPNVNQGTNQFGVVGAQGNQPRIVQFALKLSR
jgi:outer membrane receptor protein involved in Fe transport